MENKIKTTFTNEEINEYIAELNNAIGNKRKINKLLDLSHLPILVAYLRKIGVNEKLLSLAAVVEFTRREMKEILSDKTLRQCEITDSGVFFEKDEINSKPEMIGINKMGVLCLGNERYFGKQDVTEEYDESRLWPVERYVRLQRRCGCVTDPNRSISNSGWALCRMAHIGDFYLIDDVARGKDGLIYYTTLINDIDGETYYNSRIYAGEAIDVEENENTFREHYEMYTTLFPKYRGWLNNWYLRGVENLNDVVKRTDSEIFRERIEKFSKGKISLKCDIESEIEKYSDNKRRLDELLGFLSRYKCVSEEGKRVVEDVKALVVSRKEIDINEVCSFIDGCLIEESSVVSEGSKEEIGIKEENINRIKEMMMMSKFVNSIDDSIGIVDDNRLGEEYHRLKERAESLGADYEKLDEILEMLRDINCSNERLITIIEEKIRNIASSRTKSKDEKEIVSDDEREVEI